MLQVPDAIARVRALIPRLSSERIAVAAAQGRVLATDVIAGRALPGADNSAMDGFAVRAAELPATLPVVGAVHAGQPAPALAAGTALRIMTGAVMPAGADAIVMFEDARDLGDRVELPAAERGSHVRRAGEDLATGALALPAGTILGGPELSLLAALGCAQLEVARRPQVAIVATGDELVDVATTPQPYQLVDSSAHALAALVRDAGGEPRYLGIARDERATVTAMIRAALDADVVVTTGGVSAGDRDYVRDALGDAGVTLELWKVAMKPGKPLAFGRAGTRPVFGLPGNPVSTMVSFELFVRPALLAMQGAAVVDRPRVPVVLASGYRKAAGRAHFLRARLERSGERLIARLHAHQGSHVLTSMIGVDALVEIAAEVTEIAPGATAPALLLRAA